MHSYAYLDIDSIFYRIPDGYVLEAGPQPVSIETDFSGYSSALSRGDGRVLLYTRRFKLYSTDIPAEKYEAYRTFIQSVVKADQSSVALTRK